MSERRGAFAVIVAALLFGSTFVVMRDSVEAASPTAFLTARFGIGSLVLLVIARVRAPMPRDVVRPALLTGVALLAGYLLQTVGLQYTPTSTSAFITYLLVVLVPVFVTVQHRRLPSPWVAVAVAITTAGLWLLTGGVGHLGKGELFTLGCAVAYALHVMLIARFTARFDLYWFMGLQLGVVAVGCLIPGFVQGGYGFGASAWLGALYTGIGASAVALSLQAFGQRLLSPTRTALLLMLEPVSAAVIGYSIGERLGTAGWFGGFLILVGVVIAESAPQTRDEFGDHPQKLNEYKAEWPSNDPIHGGTT